MKQMKRTLFLTLTALLVCFSPPVFADVTPGETIDKSNWQKAEGLVPPFLLDWVKNGEWVLNTGKLNFDSKEYQPPAFLKARDEKLNKGKYGLGENKGIIDIKSGEKYPRDIMGFPFPDIDENDPDAGYKVAYNAYYFRSQRSALGNYTVNIQQQNINRKGKVEKELTAFRIYYFPDLTKTKHDMFNISGYSAPYNLAGSSAMTHVTTNPELKMNRWTYIPSLRKVRRLSDVIRGSEAGGGTTVGIDDTWAGGPYYKIVDAEYKLISKKEMLVPFYSADPIKLTREKDGYSVTGSDIGEGRRLAMGYETEGWTGAPWAYTNVVWVKKEVFEIEYVAKDPKYRYGPCRGWFTADQFNSVYRANTDLKNNYWKGGVYCLSSFENEDGSFRFTSGTISRVVYDAKRDLATMAWSVLHPKGRMELLLENSIDPGIFTQGGYMKFSK